MKILVITQKINKNDPILGFFHTWIEKLSQKFERVIVICLERGEYQLPDNVEVLSFGKEKGKNKLKHLVLFFYFSLKNLFRYDAVFVHMNQEYVLMGGLIWKIFGKKIYLWRNHKIGDIFTDIAAELCDKIFCTSPHSYTAKFKKTILMPVGIDTDKFYPFKNTEIRRQNSVLFLGRFDPVKRVDLFVNALIILKNRGLDFEAKIYGDPTKGNEDYHKKLIAEIKNNFGAEVEILGGIPNDLTPKIYNEHEIYVNLTRPGSFDKTILEAAACGTIAIMTNHSFENDKFSELETRGYAEDVADRIEYWLKADELVLSETRRLLQNFVKDNHSLQILINKLESCIKGKVSA